MKYEVTYACGHKGTVELFGKGSDRERKLAWYAKIDCPECAEKSQKANISKREEENDMPELSGTEKQVAWAKILRYQRIGEIKRLCNTARETFRASAPERISEADEIERKVIAWIGSKTDAKFFIDTRDDEYIFENHRNEWDA